MIKIEGLSPVDVKLMDIMWQLDTEEELYGWLDQQPLDAQKRARVLIELILMADREESEDDDVSIGRAMLKSIGAFKGE